MSRKFAGNKFEEVLKLFHTRPLFGTVTKKDRGETKWFCFFKSPGGK